MGLSEWKHLKHSLKTENVDFFFAVLFYFR